jgi:hypothetical protein
MLRWTEAKVLGGGIDVLDPYEPDRLWKLPTSAETDLSVLGVSPECW